MSAHARARIALALCATLTATVACASGAPLGFKRATAPAFPSRDVISEAELSNTIAATAYEAIQRLRPTFLSWTRSVTPYENRRVFVDGLEMGGLESLHSIPVLSIHEIRMLSGIEAAGRYGTTNSAGALVITTKLWSRR